MSSSEPPNREIVFVFVSCVRACVRAGGRVGGRSGSGCEVRFSREFRPPYTFPFSLFGVGGLPFSLVWISMILRLPEGLEVKYRWYSVLSQ